MDCKDDPSHSMWWPAMLSCSASGKTEFPKRMGQTPKDIVTAMSPGQSKLQTLPDRGENEGGHPESQLS